MDVDLKDLNRDELDQYATEHHADLIPDPTAYGKKGDLQTAIEAAAAGEPVPEPKGTASGSTVRLTKAPEGTRSVRIGDDRFLLNSPVEGVATDSVKAVKDFAGENDDYEFEID
jgi:hypothetical protein